MRNKTYILFISTLCLYLSYDVSAQQIPYFSSYYYHKTYYDIAFAPLEKRTELSLSYRNMWNDIKGAPANASIDYRMPLFSSHGAIGSSIIYDRLGNFTSFTGKIGYAYSLPLGKSMISAGLSAGITHLSIDDDWTAGTPSDPYIPYDTRSSWAPMVSVGTALWSERYYIGLSSHHVISFSHSLGDKLSIEQKNHIFLMGGYSFDISKGISLCPSGLIATDINSYFFTGNISAVIKRHFTAGFSYGNDSSFGINMGYTWKSFQLNYCYQSGLSSLESPTGSTHEILLIYRPSPRTHKKTPTPPSTHIRNIRFL